MSGNRFFTWFAVPDGSALKIKVTGSDSNFNVTGVQITEPGGVKNLSHAALVQGTSQKLVSPKAYSVNLAIVFLGQTTTTTVTVEASVIKPDGTPFGKPRPPYVTSGKNNAVDSSMIIAITKK